MTPQEQRWASNAEREQIERGIWLNPEAGLQRAIRRAGFWQVHRELNDGPVAYVRAEHPTTGEARLYIWDGAPRYIVVRPAKSAPKPPPTDPKPLPTGSAKLGLHASADPEITDAEIAEFRRLKPGIIKLLSHNTSESFRRMGAAFPSAEYIVRAFLNFGGRDISPERFYRDTWEDMRNKLAILKAHGVPDSNILIELHNEPNLTSEGYGTSWLSAAEFGAWFLRVVSLYATKFAYRYLFPGLSPGHAQPGRPVDCWSFLEACRYTLRATGVAGVGIHAYWNGDSIAEGLGVANEYARRLPTHRLYVTEASNNKSWDAYEKARQYVEFAGSLPKQYQGVTYFVASASNPAFAHETWLDKGMAARVDHHRNRG
jgi:hypothetical protein